MVIKKIAKFNFVIFESQVKKIFKVELCIQVTFVHKILISLFIITQYKSQMSWRYLDRPS